MSKSFFQSKQFDLIFFIIALLGIVIAAINLRTAIINQNNFKIFTRILMIVLFSISAISSYRSYKRRDNISL